MKKKNRTSLKWKLLRTVLLYWALPFLVLIAVIGIYMADSEENNQLEMSLDTCQERMEGDCCRSRKATYDQVLYDRYRDYCQGKISDRDFPMKPETIWTLSMDIRKTVPLQCLCLQTKKQKTNITAIILPQAEATR